MTFYELWDENPNMTLASIFNKVQSPKVRIFMYRFMRFWPPFLGAGIRISYMSQDLRTVETRMRLRFWNRNFVGTHFGGSLYAMCDPFFMLILMEGLGPDYIVWDIGAKIDFKKPGRLEVSAKFTVPEETISRLKNTLKPGEKEVLTFKTQVTDSTGLVIADVEKNVYIRRKDPSRQR